MVMDMSAADIEKLTDRLIELALAEDMGRNDVTTRALVPPDLRGQAIVLSKASGVLAGMDIARRVFIKVDPELAFETLVRDGARISPGEVLGRVSGRVAGILTGERPALNFLQRLSGIATQTAEYVARVSGLGVDIADTRKTTPGSRYLEKYAVRMGGGINHRLNLADGILIKDNHLAALRALGMGFKEIIAKARRNAPAGLKIEVEVTNAGEAGEAVAAGADIIMLDNMSPAQMRQVRRLIPRSIRVEASGGVTLANVREVAETGVDFISVGSLTHSVRSLDISIELETATLRQE